MKSDKEFFEEFVQFIEQEFNGFEIRYKNKSLFMKFLNIVLFFVPFMEYVTTISNKVYFPSREWIENNYRSAWKILAHEYVHIFDNDQEGIYFGIKYLFPQCMIILSLCSLLSIWFNNWWMLSLLWLLCLLPLPSLGRKNAEYRAYLMSMAVNVWRYRSVRQHQFAWILEQFVGIAYWYMWPFKGFMREELSIGMELVKGTVLRDPSPESKPFKDVHKLMVNAGLVQDGRWI